MEDHAKRNPTDGWAQRLHERVQTQQAKKKENQKARKKERRQHKAEARRLAAYEDNQKWLADKLARESQA